MTSNTGNAGNARNLNNDGYFDITDNGETVKSFQRMLRSISETDGNLPTIPIDGRYGEGMTEAVRQYQAQNGLNATGNVDFTTWNKVAADYERVRRLRMPSTPIIPFPGYIGFRVVRGERSDIVLILQIMLSSLRYIYDEFGVISYTGVYDTRTARAIKKFQAVNFISETDYVDKETWNSLARQYNMNLNKSQ